MRSKLILTLPLLLFGFFLAYSRFGQLDTLPPSLFSDEVDAQYQAYILNKLGTDYFGNRFPTHFHSFADWRTSLSIYTTALVQTICPIVSDISVRVASAVYGLGFLLVFSLFIYRTLSPLSGLIAFVNLAFSPWLIHFSRTGFEVTGMLFCLSLSLLFFPKNLYLSAIFLITSAYFYSTAKLLIILIFILAFFIWRSEIVKIKAKNIFKILLLSLIVALPLLKDIVSNRAGFRFSYISIFSNPQISKDIDYLRYQDILIDHQGEIGVGTPLTSKVAHNRLQYLWQNFYRNYLSSFSTDFLFLKGDSNLRQGFSDTGLVYSLDLVLFFVGLFIAFHRHPKNKFNLFFLALLLISPIPFSLTRDSTGPHASRLILLLLPLTYFISQIGLVIKKSHLIILLPAYFLFFLNFWHYYSLHYPQISARYWHTGIKEALNQTRLYPEKNLYFSNNPEPILPFFLFYYRYLPPKGTSVTQNLGHYQDDFIDGTRLNGRYYFGHLNWSHPPQSGLIVTSREEIKEQPDFSRNFKIIQVFNKNYIEQPTYLLVQPINEN